MTEPHPPPARPIALAGFMGVGKSTLGRLLAEQLDRPFFDTDDEVERRSGRTVVSFFPAEEPEFRRLEAETVAALLAEGPSVIALGGGALLDETTRARLRQDSILVHLHVPWSELRTRVPALLASRPLLQGRTRDQIHELYLARLEVYRQAAVTVTVDLNHPERSVLTVLKAIAA